MKTVFTYGWLWTTIRTTDIEILCWLL